MSKKSQKIAKYIGWGIPTIVLILGVWVLLPLFTGNASCSYEGSSFQSCGFGELILGGGLIFLSIGCVVIFYAVKSLFKMKREQEAKGQAPTQFRWVLFMIAVVFILLFIIMYFRL